MTAVLGLDLSLTGSGVACVSVDEAGHATAAVRTEKSAAVGDAVTARWDRLNDMTRRILTPFAPLDPRYDLVVVEGPSYGSSAQRSASIHDRAGLWWVVVGRCLRHGIPVAVCPPTVRAKWATGRGNAGKAEVSVGVARHWPDVTARTDDEWDALALATMGAQKLGCEPIPTLARHLDAIAKVAWPEFGAEAA